MSIFGAEERRLIEEEKEQSEIDASNEYQKEIDEAKQNVYKSKQIIRKRKHIWSNEPPNRKTFAYHIQVFKNSHK